MQQALGKPPHLITRHSSFFIAASGGLLLSLSASPLLSWAVSPPEVIGKSLRNANMENRRPGGYDVNDTAAEKAALHKGSRNATFETSRTSETGG